MTAPPADASLPPAATPRRRRRALWLDRLSVLVVVVAAGSAVGAGVPSFLRAAGVRLPWAEMAPLLIPAPSSAGAHLPPAPPHPTAHAFEENPRFAPDDDEPRITELERLYPDGMWPGHQEPRAPRRPAEATAGPRMGHARSPLAVLERADPAAPPAGQVPAGAAVMIIREAGDWVLVMAERAGGMTVGWTKRATIAIP